MSTFTIITEETPAPEVTQAEEKLFVPGLPVMYKMGNYAPELATYNYQYSYGDRHNITLADGKETVARADEITPSCKLNDSEMIYYLTEELVKASESADYYKQLFSRSQDDIQTISDALLNEAENRGWCSEYNDFCEEVNSKLTGGTYLTPSEQEWEVEVEIEATVRTTRTLYVMASSLENAQETVSEDPDVFLTGDEALDEVKSSGWDNVEVNIN